jgi:hypothetical protein
MSDVVLTSLPPMQADLVRCLRVLARVVADRTPQVILDVHPIREDAVTWCCGVTAPVFLTPSYLCLRCACEQIPLSVTRHITAEVRNPAGRWT